ncbi:MAG: tetratricopeptide repeat protein [Parvibaculaceae bacterium]
MAPAILLSALLAAGDVALAQDGRDGGGPNISAVRLKPAEIRAETLDRLFAQLLKTDDEQEAERIQKRIWDLWMTDDSPTANILIGQAMKASSSAENETALHILDSLIQVHPDFMEAWNKRATVYYMLGDYEKSVADIMQVLDREPRHFGALSGLGMIRQKQGNLAAAREAYREALSVNPHMEGIKRALQEIDAKERPI